MAAGSPQVVHVAVGVIIGEQGQIFIAKRPDHVHQGGLWEFPGGKLDGGETVQQALTRELFEELGIHAEDFSPLLEVRHDYPDKSVLLDVWMVTEFSGTAHGKEGQVVAWVPVAELQDYTFPQANLAIIEAIQNRYLIPSS